LESNLSTGGVVDQDANRQNGIGGMGGGDRGMRGGVAAGGVDALVHYERQLTDALRLSDERLERALRTIEVLVREIRALAARRSALQEAQAAQTAAQAAAPDLTDAQVEKIAKASSAATIADLEARGAFVDDPAPTATASSPTDPATERQERLENVAPSVSVLELDAAIAGMQEQDRRARGRSSLQDVVDREA
jgi:hypothetical protein